MSLRRQHPWMLKNISAPLLFYAGFASLPAFIFQQNIYVKTGQVILFAIFAVCAGKRLQWVYFLSVLATVTLFHLLVPSGAILAEPFGVPITSGALQTGIFKGITIIGMVFISLTAVRADLCLPGRLGSLVGKTFWSFEQIMERRSQLEIRSLGAGVDGLLGGLYDDLLQIDEGAVNTQERKGTAERSSSAGRAVVFVIVLSQWSLLFLSSL